MSVMDLAAHAATGTSDELKYPLHYAATICMERCIPTTNDKRSLDAKIEPNTFQNVTSSRATDQLNAEKPTRIGLCLMCKVT